MRSEIFALVMSALVLTAPVVTADDAVLTAKVELLERQMRALRSQVYGEGSAQAMPDAPAPALGDGDRKTLADVAAKIGSVERQLRLMTGRMEEIEYRQNQLDEALAMIRKEMALQRQDIVDAQAAATAAQTATQASATPVQAPAAKTATAPKAPSVQLPDADPAEQYKYAFAFIQKNDLDSGRIAMEQFLARNPGDSLAGNAKFWLGRIHLRQGQFALAAQQLLKLIEEHPNHEKRTDALLDLAEVLIELDSPADACNALAEFRRSEAKASDRLKARADRVAEKAGCGS